MVKITLYRSALCPRCHQARKVLRELLSGTSGIEVEEVDIAIHPLQAWREGIRFIPTLKSGDRTLSGMFLSRSQIRDFLEEMLL